MKLLRMSCVFMVLIASAVNASSVSEKLEKELEELNSNCKGFQGLLSEFKDDPSGRCIKGERAEDYSDAKPSRPISLSNPEKASSGSGRGSDTGSDTNNSNSQRNNAAQPDKQAGGEQRYKSQTTGLKIIRHGKKTEHGIMAHPIMLPWCITALINTLLLAMEKKPLLTLEVF